MATRDTKKSYKLAMFTYENFADKMPDKKIRKHKRKARQEGYKEIREGLKKVGK